MSDDTRQTLRLDAWLWRARFFKTRSLAAALAAKGRVKVTRAGRRTASAKPSFAIAVDDVVTFSRSGAVTCVRVVSLGVRRGPATEARMLYADALDEDAPDTDVHT